jgi:hypothetical protein
MPMHDWTRVDPNDYHTFHLYWLTHLSQSLNRNRLPEGYYAMADHTTPPYIPDVVTLTTEDAPNPDDADEGGVAVAVAPKTRISATEHGRKQKLAGRRRIAIKHVRDRHIVAVIEIVSPSNKAKKLEFNDLVGKSVQLLRQGIHLLLIDPFPPTRRDPNGIHAAVWRELTGKKAEYDADKPLTLASYAARGDDMYSSFVEPLAVGDTLPDMPLFITAGRHVPAPLEESYRTAWDGYPLPIRKLLESQ